LSPPLFCRPGLVVAGSPGVPGTPPACLVDTARLVALPVADVLQLAAWLLQWAAPHVAAEHGRPACGLPGVV
jgi:hypothetical protein